MKILHICDLSNSPFSGISIVVPQHIQAQNLISDIFVWNLNGKKIDCDAKQICEKDFYSNSFDIVIFHGVYFPKYVKIGKILKKRGTPYVIFPHGSLTSGCLRQKWMKKFIAIKLFFSSFLKNSSAIQFLTEKEMNSSIYSDKGFVCGNGVLVPKERKVCKEIFEHNKFVYVGRLDIFYKGLDLLFDAIELDKDYLLKHNFRLDIYGPKQTDVKNNGENTHEILMKMIVDRGIDQIVQIHDAVFGEEKRDVLINSDVFVQTSRSEGLPLGILEALSLGIPCLVTDGTNLADIINEYSAGWGVKTSSKTIADAVIRAVSNPNEEKMSEAAIRLIGENFTWDKIAKKEIDIYKRIVEVN